jgi:hypothetical protein
MSSFLNFPFRSFKQRDFSQSKACDLFSEGAYIRYETEENPLHNAALRQISKLKKLSKAIFLRTRHVIYSLKELIRVQSKIIWFLRVTLLPNFTMKPRDTGRLTQGAENSNLLAL